MKLPASTLIVICLAAAAFAATADDELAKLRSAINDRDNTAAVTELRSLERNKHELFLSNDLDYLLGSKLQDSGDTAGAMPYFESVRRRNSSLKSYALWHLAALARASGNLFLERLYLSEFAVPGTDCLCADAARTRLAESFLESGDQ